jgi:hypothetical protein
MKQYYIKKSYTSSYYVFQFNDGVLENYKVISYSEWPEYINALESMGYKRAYFVPDYKKRLDKAYEEFDAATKLYKEALENPLQISEEYFKTVNNLQTLLDLESLNDEMLWG